MYSPFLLAGTGNVVVSSDSLSSSLLVWSILTCNHRSTLPVGLSWFGRSSGKVSRFQQAAFWRTHTGVSCVTLFCLTWWFWARKILHGLICQRWRAVPSQCPCFYPLILAVIVSLTNLIITTPHKIHTWEKIIVILLQCQRSAYFNITSIFYFRLNMDGKLENLLSSFSRYEQLHFPSTIYKHQLLAKQETCCCCYRGRATTTESPLLAVVLSEFSSKALLKTTC